MNNENDIEQIKAIIEAMGERYLERGGRFRLAGIEGGTVKVEPSGFCWR